MKIETFLIFQYPFLLTESNRNVQIENMQTWCNENCNGRWMVLDSNSFRGGGTFTISYCSIAMHESPLKDETYPRSEIKKSANTIISFEEESDALAFKLYFTEVETHD